MITDVQSALNAVLGSVAILRHANGAGRIFELFVMTGIAAKLSSRGHDVWLQRSDGTRMNPGDPTLDFIQRGGAPAGISPASAGPGNASCIGFQKSGSTKVWEVWNGVQFEGRSGAAHELDIAIVPQQVGTTLRLHGGNPFGRPRIAVECKDVATSGSIDEMRALVARLYDVTILDGHRSHLGLGVPPQAIYPGNFAGDPYYSSQITYRQENLHSFNVFARRTGFAKGAAAMTAYHCIQPHGSITAGSPEADILFTDIADWIDANLP
ncbi:toll/interleukin-1 receptor domain-containing protein [Rhizobium sp. C4]|uniref:toll/interleukin-1 receptor domain-containing protein n=1 Tax=Rhizobium sp. C4 TaxID=1349800 RepID=UPI001E4391D1|nr:toll/interleukin-1 receptor domain-containing protein [Rhizobium sp. C4]MCD2175051.1 toll/interleukin-1 receptor domain-containing protein [Rhizobium sp. C4]